MQLEVSSLDERPAVEWTLNLVLVDDLLKAHVGLESHRELNLAIRTHLGIARQLVEAKLADNRTALLAVKRKIGQFIADTALQLLKCQFLLVKGWLDHMSCLSIYLHVELVLVLI